MRIPLYQHPDKHAVAIENRRRGNFYALLELLKRNRVEVSRQEWRLLQDCLDDIHYRTADTYALIAAAVAIPFRAHRASTLFRRWRFPLIAALYGYELGLRHTCLCPAMELWDTLVRLATPLGEAARMIYTPPPPGSVYRVYIDELGREVINGGDLPPPAGNSGSSFSQRGLGQIDVKYGRRIGKEPRDSSQVASYDIDTRASPLGPHRGGSSNSARVMMMEGLQRAISFALFTHTFCSIFGGTTINDKRWPMTDKLLVCIRTRYFTWCPIHWAVIKPKERQKLNEIIPKVVDKALHSKKEKEILDGIRNNDVELIKLTLSGPMRYNPDTARIFRALSYILSNTEGFAYYWYSYYYSFALFFSSDSFFE